MTQEQQERSAGRRAEDYGPHKCLKEDVFAQIASQLQAIEATNESNGKTLDAIATAFVDKDYVKHRIMQIEDMDRRDGFRKLKQYLIQGLVLAGVLSICLFFGSAALTRFATVTLPAAGASK